MNIINLAIVIPAYKSNYLNKTLASLANQTNKNFNVYIGDDASPFDIKEIVKDFSNILNIKYERFSENVGGKDLVSHWERCIDLVQNEEWVWLFSDDDEMSNSVVEEFYNCIETVNCDVFHFNTIVIDNASNVIKKSKIFPQQVSSSKYLSMILKGGYLTFVVEYIFRKSKYVQVGGFEKFDLAWGSDTAFWIKMSMDSGIYTLPDGYVYWRYSGENISSLTQDKSIVHRKIAADLSFISWINQTFKNNRSGDLPKDYHKICWVIRQLKDKDFLSIKERLSYVRLFLTEFNIIIYFPLITILVLIFRATRLIQKTFFPSTKKRMW